MSTLSTNLPREEIIPNTLEHDDDLYDVLIIGAGPCGLAAAARLREQAPSAMFTDEEHRRFHWLGKHGSRVALKHPKSGRVTGARSSPGGSHYKMAVLDESGGTWLGRWKNLFSTFDISHLRSPMLWHVDPQDRDSLLSYGHMQGRADELVEIRGCVGKEMSKHQKKKQRSHQFSGGKKDAAVNINQRDQWDYYTPSQSLFCDHCSCVAERYNLNDEDMIHHEAVRNIRYGFVERVPSSPSIITTEKIFTVTSNHTIRYARAIILAVGPANSPVLPSIPSLDYPGQTPSSSMPQTCHSMHIPQQPSFPAPIVLSRIAQRTTTNILVIGGGLTSAQLADLALRRGVTRVWHLMRGPLRTKAFDVDLHWMGKYKTLHQAYFHQADSDEERLEIIREARGGGSIPPAFMKRLRPHLASGRLQLFERTVLTEAVFTAEESSSSSTLGAGGADGEDGGKWTIKTSPPIPGLPSMDFIYFATGIQSDVTTLPYLQNMLKDHPIQSLGGFPCLNEDLMWKDDVPLFVAGRLAALKLGPAAPNIGGARVGAERIALALDDFLFKTSPTSGSRAFLAEEENTVKDEDRRDSGVEFFNYASGTGSKYSVLMQSPECVIG